MNPAVQRLDHGILVWDGRAYDSPVIHAHSSEPFWRMPALFIIAAGTVAFHWDTNLMGVLVVMSCIPGQTIAYTSYRPSSVGLLTGLAIIAYGFAAF